MGGRECCWLWAIDHYTCFNLGKSVNFICPNLPLIALWSSCSWVYTRATNLPASSNLRWFRKPGYNGKSLVVTKASGTPGGEDTKCTVAAELGIPLPSWLTDQLLNIRNKQVDFNKFLEFCRHQLNCDSALPSNAIAQFICKPDQLPVPIQVCQRCKHFRWRRQLSAVPVLVLATRKGFNSCN